MVMSLVGRAVPAAIQLVSLVCGEQMLQTSLRGSKKSHSVMGKEAFFLITGNAKLGRKWVRLSLVHLKITSSAVSDLCHSMTILIFLLLGEPYAICA